MLDQPAATMESLHLMAATAARMRRRGQTEGRGRAG
jgi:hypothetical protein